MGWLHEFEAVIREVERLRILKHGARGVESGWKKEKYYRRVGQSISHSSTRLWLPDVTPYRTGMSKDERLDTT